MKRASLEMRKRSSGDDEWGGGGVCVCENDHTWVTKPLSLKSGEKGERGCDCHAVPYGTAATMATAKGGRKKACRAGEDRNRFDEESRPPISPGSVQSQNIKTQLHTAAAGDAAVPSTVTRSHEARLSPLTLLTLTTDSLNLMCRR